MAPRLSHSAETARAAAAQAEFNEKKWVWVPDEKEGYLAGWVNKEDGDLGEVIMAAGGEFRRVPLYALSKMNPPKFDRSEDIADLTFLNEASVVHNLRLRYGSGAIYTYSGLFLVAINPYQSLPLYSDAIVQQYRGKRRDENPPHIFAVAERAWVNMGEERENQSILITGESGAGKTESTKKVIQYLAAIATDAHAPSPPSHSRSPTVSAFGPAMPTSGLPRSNSRRGHNPAQSTGSHLTAKGRLGLLERQILQANPVLEAFGNAQTQRNNNSSRFGKFVRITFSPDGSIAGANIDWYLLEKSRVVVRSEAERSFHVFYQLLTGGGSLKSRLLLDGGIEDYEYLNGSRREVDGIDDVHEWKTLKAGLDVVGFTEAEQFDLFRVVAAILHIGNIAITATRADDAVMPDPSQAERVCHLLGIPVAEFTRAVLSPRVLAGREWVTQARTQRQAIDELASLCKTLYEKSFGFIVDRINQALDRPSSKSTFIGVLDIAGFEIFEVNTYEQLLINYTNEKLQQFFNHHMFVLEQEEYSREGIKWDYVNFGLDLQPTIDLIEATGQSIGILSCLDEECIMPRATDKTFTHKLNTLWGQVGNVDDHPGKTKYESARFEQGFLIQHYAAKVEYRTDGWLEKNKDPLNDNLTRVLAAAKEKYISNLFADFADGPTGPVSGGTSMFGGTVPKRRVKKGAFRTVGQRHKEQLSSLMTQLHATQPHFVRCIVPNNHKKPGRIDVPLVLDQLRCNGVLEGIRIARLGYPNRLPFVEFRQRYEVLTPGIIPPGYMDGREACRRMVKTLELDDPAFKIGTSKIFFKAGVLAELEERRDTLLFDIFSRLQAAARRWTARRQIKKVLNRAVAIRTIQKNARIYGELRDWPWWRLYTKVRPLLAATRNDEELRQKELELKLMQERAEREKIEKQNLENLKMTLESEKRKIVDELEAERALGLDKDELLDRSKKRESELEAELADLQADAELLDSQLARAMDMQKKSEENHVRLRKELADEYLAKLESEQAQWVAREDELNVQISSAQDELDALRISIETLEKSREDLKALREQDLARAQDRNDAIVKELQGKLDAEAKAKVILQSQVESHDIEARQAKEQLAELARTANEYTAMLEKKEERIGHLLLQLENGKRLQSEASQELNALRSDIDTLTEELEAEQENSQRTLAAHTKLQDELDELRTSMAAKTSEEARRLEAEKSMEIELGDLRSQVLLLQQELTEARKVAMEHQNKLKLDLSQATRELEALQTTHKGVAEKEKEAQGQLVGLRANVSELEKAKRLLESELQAVKTRQHEHEDQVAEARKAQENAERQLAQTQTKYHKMEDMMLELERDKKAEEDASKKLLEAESIRRSKFETMVASQKSELALAKDRAAKLDKELNKALKDLKDREWEVKQLESRQDKTIVEHVHVLEEAKRVTDRQLADAQLELSSQTAYIRSLEKVKSRLTSDVEDLSREADLGTRNRDKAVRVEEEKTAKALAETEKARREKDNAEAETRRLQMELQNAKRQAEEATQELGLVQRSKTNLETELERLANDTRAPVSMAKMQRQYESRIAQLEEQVADADSAQVFVDRMREHIDRHHEELRKLVMNSGPMDSSFQSRLLEELKLADEDLERELAMRNKHSSADTSADIQAMGNLPPRKTHSSARSRDSVDVQANSPDRQIAVLKQQMQVLELHMAASERVRKHLESSLRDVTAEMDTTDGSKASMQSYRARLAKENARLAELVKEEAEARHAAQAAQIDGVQAIWAKFQSSIDAERQNYSRLEESRKALLVQQRTVQVEMEAQKAVVRELNESKKRLQAETDELRVQLNEAKTETSTVRRRLEKRVQEAELKKTTNSAAQSEMRGVIESFKAKEAANQERFEKAEIERAKAARAEAFVRRSLADLEKTHSESTLKLKTMAERLKASEARVKELSARVADDSSGDLILINQRLVEELEDEKARHAKDLEQGDFASDQTRKKYQAELAQLSEELQSQRDSMSRLREENRKLRSDYDELQLTFDDEVYNSGGWKKEKERLETKIADVTKAYEASSGAQAEQQSTIVTLHGQVRQLRAMLDEVESDRALLHNARRSLQVQLEEIRSDQIDRSRIGNPQDLQRLTLQKQDLQRSLEEQGDRVAQAYERMKKAEQLANEFQSQLSKSRVDYSQLERHNATLEKQIKELNVKIVDLETQAYSSSRPTTISRNTRIDDLASKLQQASNKSEVSKLLRDANFQQAEVDRHRLKFEEERRGYENEIAHLRGQMDSMATQDSDLHAAKRRAEREAADYKQKALSLQHELERTRNRLERPSGVNSPHGSPRK
ncbi:nonmuscle myosin heavy chain b [Cylindrobasidium torrendii FP15055 ss-10]|uniref:Nonmuscle myosin heavy chain b n=1 Tax=Cylindrobasidium torrendii FP15055 ss-10 TaxID=1314674 RepID=A0A0D7BJN7_9AGAR|nr:nonmuscle myosin heavy chain b [Cylindrobasidium torrendii FP15055 ss-10]